MKFTFKAITPPSYRGLKHVDYPLSKPLISTDPAETGYSNSGPEIPGYPIALSTAQWHLDGEATNSENQLNPGAAGVASTTNMANWTIALASGNGASPTSLPGPNGPWMAPGDNVRKYANYNRQPYANFGSLASEVELAQHVAGAGQGAYDHWDHTIAQMIPDPAADGLFMPGGHFDQVSSHRRETYVPNSATVFLLRETRTDRVLDPIGPLNRSFSHLIRLA